MEFNLKIDPEFQGKIPPLSEAEFSQLEENILKDGRIKTPISVWKGTIVDGHNRYKIAQMHPEIPWETEEMDFADKWEAFDWMYRNQLGRRNLAEEQYTYLKGKMYEARKHTHGGERGNQYTKVASGQNDHLAKANKIREQLAKELGTTPSDIRRSYEFSRGIDAIKEEDPDLAASILDGKKKVPKSAVRDAGNVAQEARGKIIKAIKEERQPVPRMTKEDIKKNQEDIEQIERYVEESRATGGEAVMTIDDLIADIKVNSEPYIRLLGRIITGYASIIKGNSDIVIRTINEFSINEINKIKERIVNDYA